MKCNPELWDKIRKDVEEKGGKCEWVEATLKDGEPDYSLIAEWPTGTKWKIIDVVDETQ